MRSLSLSNPFGAPVYWTARTTSTMDESRRLAAEGAVHGTAVMADFQEAGRGRIRDRPWTGRAGENLYATILFRYPGAAALPPALSLRTGLALALAIEDFAPALAGLVRIKWPNDVMIFPSGPGAVNEADAAGKAAGILTETDGKTVFIGFGVNTAQTEFPEELRGKAISIALALDGAAPSPALPPESRFALLEKILVRLHQELEGPGAGAWMPRLEQRLYMRGRPVRFIAGAAGSGRVVEGRLAGIGKAGELLILPSGAGAPLAFFAGELDAYGLNPARPPG